MEVVMKLFVYTFDYGIDVTSRTHEIIFAESREKADILAKIEPKWGLKDVKEFPIQPGRAGSIV